MIYHDLSIYFYCIYIYTTLYIIYITLYNYYKWVYIQANKQNSKTTTTWLGVTFWHIWLWWSLLRFNRMEVCLHLLQTLITKATMGREEVLAGEFGELSGIFLGFVKIRMMLKLGIIRSIWIQPCLLKGSVTWVWWLVTRGLAVPSETVAMDP